MYKSKNINPTIEKIAVLYLQVAKFTNCTQSIHYFKKIYIKKVKF